MIRQIAIFAAFALTFITHSALASDSGYYRLELAQVRVVSDSAIQIVSANGQRGDNCQLCGEVFQLDDKAAVYVGGEGFSIPFEAFALLSQPQQVAVLVMHNRVRRISLSNLVTNEAFVEFMSDHVKRAG